MCQYLNICLRKCPSKALPEHIVLTIQQKYTIGFQGIESNFFFFLVLSVLFMMYVKASGADILHNCWKSAVYVE